MTSTPATLQASIAVTRFGLGARRGELDEVSTDPRGWLSAQIRPEGADVPAGAWRDAADRLLALRDYRQEVRSLRIEAGLPARPIPVSASLQPPTQQPMQASGAAFQPAASAGADRMAARRAAKRPLDDETDAEVLARAQLAATTPAGFRERWTLFWSNHFTTAGKNEEMRTLAPVFEREAVRPHVFARFSTLLTASSTHAGMLHYLDQVRSIGPDSPAGARNGRLGLNENLAREILELHTVGADAGYTQADVTEFARALTGLTVGDGRAAERRLRPGGVPRGLARAGRPHRHGPALRRRRGRRGRPRRPGRPGG